MPVTILNRRPVEAERAAPEASEYPPAAGVQPRNIQLLGRRPIGEPEPDGNEWSDYGRQAMSTFASMGAGLGWLGQKLGEKTGVDFLESAGRGVKETGHRAAESWLNDSLEVIGITQEGLSDNARRAMEIDFLGAGSFGDKWNKAKLLALGSLPATLGGLGAGGLIAKGLGSLGVGSTVAGAVGYGLGEAGVAAPMAGAAVDQEIMGMTHDELLQSPEYQRVFESLSGLPAGERYEKSKALLASAAAGDAAAMTMVSTFLLSAPAGAILSRYVPGAQAQTGRIVGGAKGAVTESIQEFFQSATEAMSQNIAMREAGFDRDLWDNVLEEAVGGAIAGAPLGGAVGFAAPGGPAQPPPQPGPEAAAAPDSAVEAETVIGDVETESRERAPGGGFQRTEPLVENEREYPFEDPEGRAYRYEAGRVIYPQEEASAETAPEAARQDVEDDSPTVPNLKILNVREVPAEAGEAAPRQPSGEQAAQADSGVTEPAPRPARSQRVANASQDSLLEYLSKTRGSGAQSAGISTEAAIAEGIDPADIRTAAGHGIRRPFTKGGMGFDAAAELLAEAGFPVLDERGNYDPNIVLDIIGRELAGQKVYSSRNQFAVEDEYRRQAEAAGYDDNTELPDVYFEALAPNDREPPEADLVRINDLAVRASVVGTEDQIEWAGEAETDEEYERRLTEIVRQGREARPESARPRAGEPEAAPRARAPAEQAETDLLGEDVRAQQALADETRRRDDARNAGQDSVETGDPTDLFSQARQQTDLVDAARQPEVFDRDDASLTDRTRSDIAGEAPDRARLIALRNYLDEWTEMSSDSSHPPSAIELLKRIEQGIEKGQDTRELEADAAENIREWLKDGGIDDDVASELRAFQRGFQALIADREQSELFVEWGGQRLPVASIEDAQDKWDAFREQSEAGASEIGGAVVVDAKGNRVGEIAYNGKFFPSTEERADEQARIEAPKTPDEGRAAAPEGGPPAEAGGRVPATARAPSDAPGEAVTDRINRAIRDFAMEQQGQAILDDLEEAGTSPRDVATQFWRSTYPRLNGGTQRKFRRYVERLSGFKPGDTVGTNADGSPVVAETPLDLADFVNEDLPGEAQNLQDIERGYVAMMAWANQQAEQPDSGEAKPAPKAIEAATTSPATLPDKPIFRGTNRDIGEMSWWTTSRAAALEYSNLDDGGRIERRASSGLNNPATSDDIRSVLAELGEPILEGPQDVGYMQLSPESYSRADDVISALKARGHDGVYLREGEDMSPNGKAIESILIFGEAPQSQADIDAAAHQAATSPTNDRPQPTQAQKEANGEGNYKLGDPVRLYGVTWRVENPKGSFRYRFDESLLKEIQERVPDTPIGRKAADTRDLFRAGRIGAAFKAVRGMQSMAEGIAKKKLGEALRDGWYNKMPAHYARAVEIEGADGDKLDAYLGPKSADQTLPVYVIDTNKLADGKTFDESKIMVGFESQDAARKTFMDSYSEDVGERIFRGITEMAPAEFETWAKSESKEPAGEASVRAPAEAVSESKEPGTKIEDFGEVLEGARKHAWEAYRDRLGEAGDVAAEPLSKSWPEPDYQKLIEEGADPWTVAFIHAARDEIPPKPRKGWKIRQWVEQTTALREFARGILSGNTTKEQITEALSRPEFSRLATVMNGRIDLYMAAGHEKSLKGVSISVGRYSVIGGEKIDPPRTIWTIERKAKATAFSNWPTQLAQGDTREEAIAAFKRDYSKIETQPKASKQVKFSIYSYRTGPKAGKWIIGKKIGRDRADLKEFDSVKEARAYLNEHQADLEKALEQYKNIPEHRKESNAPRVGHDHRNGADVAPDLFSETFGFRGVQFGNYVEGKRRQQDLNRAYDALLDLAGVLNVQPKALSLNGELGLAFGARGKGGKRAAAAHYEPDTVVINLTKREGAGSLAHEWFHALDNYFSRHRGHKAGFMTVSIGNRTEGVRPEVVQAFDDVMKAIRQTGLQQRSKGLDRRRTNAYWSTGEEMAARAFESYVVAKLQDQGQSNDYLANIVSEDYWKAAAALGVGEGTEAQPDYPYPTAAEIPVIRAAFDSLFEIIETQETDLGVLLFALEPQQGTRKAGLSVKEIEKQIGKIVERWQGMPARVVVANRKSLSKVPEAVRQGIERLDPSGRMMGLNHRSGRAIYLFADNIPTLKEAERILIHEAKGHAGVEAFLGDQYARFRDLAFREFPKLAVEQARHIRADVSTVDGRNRVGDEIIATIAERIEARTATAKMLRFWDALVQAIRRFVSNVLGFEHYRPTKAELRNVIREAARRVETGPPAQGDVTADGAAAALDEINAAIGEPITPENRKDRPSYKRMVSSYRSAAQNAIDLWNDKIGWRYGPLGKMPDKDVYLVRRYRALGKIGAAQDVGRNVYDALSKASAKDQVAVYEYMTTRDADPSVIENEEVRKHAVSAKEMIDRVGKRLVDVGLLSRHAYIQHSGEYLPRLYLKHLLGKENTQALGGGKKLSDLGYLKKRKDIPEEVRKVILGEITDPAFLASFGLTRTLRDLAIMTFLDEIAANKNWVPDGATVEWNRRQVSPFWLKAEAESLRRRARLYTDEIGDSARRVADRMDALADSAIEQLGDIDDKAYSQVPDSPRYGILRGTWVRSEIYEDLVGAHQMIPRNAGWAETLIGQGGHLTKVTRIWKMSKVALNPPTQVRNFVSNMILLHFANVPMRRIFSGEIIVKAIRSIRQKDKYYKIAKKYGLFQTTFSNQELFRIEEDWLRIRKDEVSGFARLRSMGATVINAASDVYGLMEAVGKIAKLIDAMEREGKAEDVAMLEAHDALFDYSLVPKSVQYLRNSPIGMPFLSFTYFVMPKMAKAAVKNPEKFLPYAAVPAMLGMLLQSMFDVDDDDLDKLKKALPSWMQERGQMLLLPYKDQHGRWQVVDFGYILPWGMFTDVAASLSQGQPIKTLTDIGVLGGPIPDVIAAIKTNRDPFTDREIINPVDPPFEKLQSLMAYVWNLAMPGFMTDSGALDRMGEALQGNVNRRGEPGYTSIQAMFRLFGINIYPADPTMTRADNLSYMRFQLDEMGRRQSTLLRDPNLSREDREKISRVWARAIEDQAERMQQYARDSEVHPNLR